jgi:mannose-6-phosphate isomerase-like protein (cupin superfamily)
MTLKEELTEKAHVVEKPWGHEEWLSVTKRYVLKKLVLKKGARFSLQYHKKKEESLYLLAGSIRLTLGKPGKQGNLETSLFRAGETIHLPPKMIHRAEAQEASIIIEASTPHLLDVVRLSDDYRREGTSKP